jgi:mannan endo-1,4-beta-mannosidase
MDVSAYIKSLDSRHLVTLGDEGFGLEGDGSYPFQYTEGLDFAKNLGISTLDFATFHMYPSHWDQNDDWGNFWIKAHGAACVTAQKPCLLEECELSKVDIV